MKRNRLHWIDCAKGLGCAFVVWGHVAPGTILTEWIFSFHMPLFFMISGILLAFEVKKEVEWGGINKKESNTNIISVFRI